MEPESRHSRQGSLSCLQQIHHTRVAAGQASDKEYIHGLRSLLVDCEAQRLRCAISDVRVVTKAKEIRVEDPEAVATHIQLTSIFLHFQGPLGPFYSLFDHVAVITEEPTQGST